MSNEYLPGYSKGEDTVADYTIPVPFNDEHAVEAVFDRHGEEIAAVLTESLLGNTGIVLSTDGYHDTLRDLCDEHGSLFVFDRVITGFRVGGLQCSQGKFGVTPDLTTFAKIIGGGFRIGLSVVEPKSCNGSPRWVISSSRRCSTVIR